PKSAARIVFYLLKRPRIEIDNLIGAFSELKKSVKICFFCQNPFEPARGGELLCKICSNPKRDITKLCIVEKEADLDLLEKTRKYQGLYFILGGFLTPLRRKETEKLIVENLLKRIKSPNHFGLAGANFQEIILAISYTTEGEASALYLERVLKPFNLKITRLGQGLPIGGEIEYADEETLSSALEGRREVREVIK
ncbi:MAG: recombination mediator RecR, partial [bacterium]|nr:recombination mediator RecR [bacterium]